MLVVETFVKAVSQPELRSAPSTLVAARCASAEPPDVAVEAELTFRIAAAAA